MEEIENLKEEVTYLRKELTEFKDKYIKLLESKLFNEQSPKESPQRVSNKEFQLDKLQLLILLKDSKAFNKEFAVTAGQLAHAFGINRTIKTVRNRLNELEFLGYVDSIGLKPKAFHLTPKGMSVIRTHQRGLLEFRM